MEMTITWYVPVPLMNRHQLCSLGGYRCGVCPEKRRKLKYMVVQHGRELVHQQITVSTRHVRMLDPRLKFAHDANSHRVLLPTKFLDAVLVRLPLAYRAKQPRALAHLL
jgi:hypothetical protein